MSLPSNPSAPSTSAPPSDPELVEQLKQQLAATEQRLQYAELKILVLEDSKSQSKPIYPERSFRVQV